MGESVKKFGVEGKKRFTIKYSDGRTESVGTCDPKQDERYGIVESEILGVQKFFLVQYQHHDTDYSQPEKQRMLLPDDVLVCNGYYEAERDAWVSPSEWLNQP